MLYMLLLVNMLALTRACDQDIVFKDFELGVCWISIQA
jgi:hypothetical protein